MDGTFSLLCDIIPIWTCLEGWMQRMRSDYKKELDSASVDLVVWEIASAIVIFLVASGCARMRLASLFLLLEHRQLYAH